MKRLKFIAALSAILLFTGSVFSGVDIRCYNKDSKDHEFKVKTCGSNKTVEFAKSSTTSVTIQSGCEDAIIYTSCGEVKVKDGDKIEIKNGCITIK